jgi:hypothetical protein
MSLDPRWPGGPRDRERLDLLLEDAARRIAEARRPAEVNPLLQPLARRLERSWPPRSRSIALLRSPEVCLVFELPFEVPDRVTVADAFHTKPLLRDADRSRYYVVLLLPDRAELLEGTPEALVPVEAARLPRALRDALAGAAPASPGGRLRLVGAASEDAPRWRERFRAIDAALGSFLEGRGSPLVLAGEPERHGAFRSVSAYPHLLDDAVLEGVEDPPELSALHERTWSIVRTHHERMERLAASQFVGASLRGEASDRLDEIAAAAADGRVGLLLHREGAHVSGTVDPRSGECRLAPEPSADGDLIDALCDLTLLRGGDVVEVHPSRMPSDSPIAAVFWS